jgi:hypothetical protein
MSHSPCTDAAPSVFRNLSASSWHSTGSALLDGQCASPCSPIGISKCSTRLDLATQRRGSGAPTPRHITMFCPSMVNGESGSTSCGAELEVDGQKRLVGRRSSADAAARACCAGESLAPFHCSNAVMDETREQVTRCIETAQLIKVEYAVALFIHRPETPRTAAQQLTCSQTLVDLRALRRS